MDKQKLLTSIRKVPDYPKEGILFYDITTIIGNGEIFFELIEFLHNRYKNEKLDFIAGIESRGFIFASALAYSLGIGFVPIRKKGKLPFTTVSEKYSLEYGFDEMEIHIDAFGGKKNSRVLLLDDLIATGGTAKASINLINAVGGVCVEACFILRLNEFDSIKEIEKKTKVFNVLDI
ncbi:adenine phosphoribosyltransferase [Helicobacter sp. MIT 14-3879]|uniref:adenine phosphoribosyltransferase n=1 Tax=Helicobacter sp. MIT 14-3879 TaxID=2040649 RepID=UPI000E1F3FBE|nr:adenine phosphoribosyltransferase [Helicobacter sp. MIT 14-3879]RDU64175.1 adenine phosphoribosyltransferase [Helicobacter sp. MIT 14-3879]